MKKLTGILFFAIVTALGVMAFLVDSSRRPLADAAGNLLGELPVLNPADADSFTISSNGNTIKLFRENGLWKVAERDNAQADTAFVAEFLTSLSSIRPLKEMEVKNDEALEELELSEKSPRRVAIEVRNSSGDVVYSVDLGAAHYSKEPEKLGGVTLVAPDGRYIGITDKSGRRRAFLISRVFMKCAPVASVWLEPLRIGALDNPLHMRFMSPDAEGKAVMRWWVLRDPSSGTYVFAEPKNPANRVALPKLTEMLKMLSTPFSINVLPREASSQFKPNAVFQIVLMNGVSYDIQFQHQDDRPYAYAKMDVKFDPNSVIREPGEIEHAYSERVKNLAARVDFEKQAYQNRVFAIRADVVSSLAETPLK